MPDAVASMVTLQIGVGTSPPVGKSIFNVSAVSDTMPENVPSLFLWQDAHVPSAGSTARVIVRPETESPVCASVRVMMCAPCESDPLPVHVPVRLSGGGTLRRGGASGATGELPQPQVRTATARLTILLILCNFERDSREVDAG
jgi:hypothetical protein